MILDRDRGNELIDTQADAAGVIGEQRIVGRQGDAGGQFKIAGGALPAEDVSRAALVAAMEPGELTAADRRPFVAELDRLKVSVELYGMRVRRYPRLAADERIETGPDVQIVLEEAGVGLRASEELTPGDLVAFQAGQLEAREAFRRRRLARSVERFDALERDPVQLTAHVREAIGVAIEVDEIDLHPRMPGASRLVSLSVERLRRRLRRSAHTFICAPSSTTRSEGKLKKSGALAACLVMAMNSLSCHRGIPELGAVFSVRRPRKNEVVMMSNLSPALRIAANARGICGCSI